jgi:predicted short-subunit dehydrogenase-like oxidoreductase (DUF2520 family)
VVGAGRVGTGLAVLLMAAGHHIVAASGREQSRARVDRYLRDVPFGSDADAARAGDAVILAVPDEHIETTCSRLAAAGTLGSEKTVLHLSGSVSLGALEPARQSGAVVLSLHPLQSAPDVDAAINRFPGSAMAVTATGEDAYQLGERLARDAGGKPFRLPDEWKPLYHAAAVFGSNYLVVVESMADRLLHSAGLDNPVDLLAPLARATLENYLSEGASALTGPAARGDVGTVRRNLKALAAHAPEAVAAYVVLARAALDLAEDAGRLDPEARARVEEALEWK